MDDLERGEVRIPAERLLVTRGNHGGYLEGECLMCGAVGWLDRLDHKEGCTVALALKYKRSGVGR